MTDELQTLGTGDEVSPVNEQSQVEVIAPVEESTEVKTPTNENATADDPEGYVKRVNKLTAKAKQAEELYMQEQRKNLLMQQQLQQFLAQQEHLQKQAAPTVDAYAPKPPDRNAYINDPLAYADKLAEYYEARNQFEQRKAAIQYEQQKRQQEEQELELTYSAQVKVAKSQYPDWDDTFENLNMAATQANQANLNELVANIKAMPNGADIVYYLGKNDEEFVQLSNLSPRKALVKLAELNARVKQTPKLTTNAPPPPKQIKGEVTQMKPFDDSIESIAKRLASKR